MNRRFSAIFGMIYLTVTLHGVVPEKYQSILDRNAFALVPPPTAPVEAAPAAPPLDVKVTGFAKIAGQKRVFFTIPSKKPQEFPQYIALREGEESLGIYVISISDLDGTVQVRNAGKEVSLTLKDNGMQASKGHALAATAASAAVSSIATPAPVVASTSSSSGSVSPVYNPNSVGTPRPTGAVYSTMGTAGRNNQGATSGINMASGASYSLNAPGTGGGNYPHVNSNSGGFPGTTPVGPGGRNGRPNSDQPNFPEPNTPRPDYSDRGYWTKYYHDMGWPADRPLPIDVAAQLNPGQ